MPAVGRLNDAKERLGSELPHLQFNVTLSSRNLGELEKIVRLAGRFGVRSLDLRHMIVLEGLDDNYILRFERP